MSLSSGVNIQVIQVGQLVSYNCQTRPYVPVPKVVHALYVWHCPRQLSSRAILRIARAAKSNEIDNPYCSNL